MPFNGSGLFVREYNWTLDASNGIDILPARFDGEDNDFAAGLSNCITRDGQGGPTGAINWNGQNLTNVGTFNSNSPIGVLSGGTGSSFGASVNECSGYTLTTPTITTIGIAKGLVGADTYDGSIQLASAFTKTFSNFVAGSGNGGLDTGTVANSTWYHVFSILMPATNTIDILLSASATSPTMPTGYTKKAKIGAVYINSSGTILPFSQNGNEFLYRTPIADINGGVLASSTPAFVLHTVPIGVKVNALFRASIACSTGGNQSMGTLFYSPDESSISNVTATNASLSLITPSSTTYVTSGDFSVRTNTSSQTMVLSNANLSASSIYVNTRGFIYPRGNI